MMREEFMTFKEKFLATPPGPEREKLIFNAVINQGPPKDLVPVEVPGPNNSKIRYFVMPDFISIEGIRVPLTGSTAQKIADYFHMNLPTPKISKQIWQNADTKLEATPLSGTGVTINNKYYSPQDVVSKKLSDSDTSVAFNEKIDQQLSKHPKGKLIAGHMKDIVAPQDKNKLGLYGWYDKAGNPIQNSAITPHDPNYHTEYASGARLVSNEVEIVTQSGKVIKTTMDKLTSHPELFKLVANQPGKSKYSIDQEKSAPKEETPKFISDKSTSPQSPKIDVLKRLDDILNKIK
jgi:hypothetical protein